MVITDKKLLKTRIFIDISGLPLKMTEKDGDETADGNKSDNSKIRAWNSLIRLTVKNAITGSIRNLMNQNDIDNLMSETRKR